jgi:hypothetical protein
MTTDKTQILDKIQKMMAKAKNNTSPEEAATAAALAAKMMEKHNIEEADLDLGGEEDVVEETFGIPGSHRSGDLKSKSTWQGELAAVIAPAFGCACIWRIAREVKSTRLVIAGQPRDVKAAIAAKDFCHREIDKLTAKFAGGQGRAFGVSFRVGCVQAIRKAIDEERAALRKEMEGHVSETALVVVDSRAQEAMESFGKVRKSRSNRNENVEAFMRGMVAGQNVWSGTKTRIEG